MTTRRFPVRAFDVTTILWNISVTTSRWRFLSFVIHSGLLHIPIRVTIFLVAFVFIIASFLRTTRQIFVILKIHRSPFDFSIIQIVQTVDTGKTPESPTILFLTPPWLRYCFIFVRSVPQFRFSKLQSKERKCWFANGVVDVTLHDRYTCTILLSEIDL